MDMPATAQYDLREACIVRAASHYGAHPDIIRAVLKSEGGKPGQIRRNKDGSFDMGPMQINSVHLPELAKYGITQAMLTNDECLNIHIGTFYLQRHIITTPGFGTPSGYWKAVGKYHSATPEKNIRYQYRVWGNLIDLRNDATRGVR